ncbi:MAG: sugar ABC transporter permease [Spirochaetae bacterium HGW-Spirochaetae-9]|nr:MAG: sugar ABC transporter permease [Spirochaetae bacterium HGW-Spirochaetae-9]
MVQCPRHRRDHRPKPYPTPQRGVGRSRHVKRRKTDGLAAGIFLFPSLLVFGIFVFFPLVYTFWLSATDWNLISPDKNFLAFGNYLRLLRDSLFWRVLANTAIFSVSVVVLAVSLGLFIAVSINRKIAARTMYRTMIFLPYVTATSAMALVWLWIFDPQYGFLNMVLRSFGIHGPEWLGSTSWAMPAIVIMTVWRFTGYIMLLYLGGLQSINGELLEAASVEGASRTAIFWKITFPLLSPTTLFVVITTLITMLQNFETVYIMTQGGPVNSTNMLVLYIYQNAFQYFEAGYASAVSVLLFLMMIGLTAIQLGSSKKWVTY